MATPTSLPASFSTGAVLTAAEMNNLRGAFRILQVIHFSISTGESSTSATYADSVLTTSITPSSTSNKILVYVNQSGYTSTAGTSLGVRLNRGATVLQTQADVIYGSNSANGGTVTFMYLDNPATTSSVTYKTQFARLVGGGTVYLQVNTNPANMVLMEVSL